MNGLGALFSPNGVHPKDSLSVEPVCVKWAWLTLDLHHINTNRILTCPF